jgi:hypothetical protein
MRRISKILFFLLCSIGTKANPDSTKTWWTARTTHPPKIDGVLEAEIWSQTQPVSDFVMNRPIEGGVPTYKTEVSILYDDNALYVGAMMYDDHPDSILHELGVRDDDLNADLFRFVVDPYNIRLDAFEFAVYASGVQIDYKFSDGTYNAVWASAVKINDKGWCVEMRIPYAALRFPKTPVQEWAVQTTRNIRRTREFDQWSLTPSGVANGLFYWGTLKGINDIKTPLRLSVLPYASSYYTIAPDPADPTKNISSFDYKIGADLKYGINDNFTLDMTLLPDFGQVQADKKVKNITFQEVMYDEYRQFFKEGTDLFSKNNLFYSRRIGITPRLYSSLPYMLNPGETIISNPNTTNLLNAIKLSGRNAKGLGLGVFNAITDNMYARVKDSLGNERKILTEPVTNFNILVADQQLKNNSSIWLINTNTNRWNHESDANVTGAGYSLALFDNKYATDGSFNFSQILNEENGKRKNTTGYNYFIGFRKSSGKFQYGLSRRVYSDTYHQMDLGPFTAVNYENNRGYIVHQQFQPGKYLRSNYSEVSVDYSRNYLTKKNTGVSINGSVNPVFMSFHSMSLGAGITPVVANDYNEARLPGRYYKTLRYWYTYVGFSSDARKKIQADVNFTISNFIDNYLSEGYTPGAGVRYRISDKLTVRAGLGYNFDPYNLGAADWFTYPDTVIFGIRKMHTYETNFYTRYIFTNNMSLSLTARHYWSTAVYRKYFNLEQNGALTAFDYPFNNNFSYNYLSIDLIYSWQFAPGSILTAGYKNIIETQSSNVVQDYGKNITETIDAPQTNTFSLRLIYFFDYLYLKSRQHRNQA